MGRKVSVTLEANVAGFITPVQTADHVVDDLSGKVKTLDHDITKLEPDALKAGLAMKSLDHELEKIPPDALRAGATLKLLGGDVNSVGDKVNSLGEKNTGLAILDSKIRQTKSEVKKLADEFVKTGDIDVFRKLGDAQGHLRGLEAVRKKLAAAIVPDEHDVAGWFKRLTGKVSELGDSIAKMLPASISGALSTPVLGPIIAAAFIAALVAAVSTVLATAGGLISGAAVGGVVGLGIMGAILGNPEVIKARWKTAIDGIKTEFVNSAQPLQQPLIDAAAQVQAAFGSMHLEQTFAKAASYLQPLVDGGLEFARYIGQAVNYLTENAGPVVKVLAEELPKIGQAIAEASKSISEGGQGGAQALKDLLGVIEMVIAGLGGMIGAAEKVYEKLAKFRDAVIPRDWLFPPDTPQHLDNAARALGHVDDVSAKTVADLNALSSTIPDVASGMDRWAENMVDHVFSALMGVDQATLGFNESLTQLDDTLKRNGKTLDEHTEKGQANVRAILSSVQANMQAYKSNIDVGMSAEDAAKAYEAGTAAIEAHLRKLGLTSAQIDELIGKYKNIPGDVNRDITFHGLEEAIRDLNTTLRLINGIHDKTVTITVKEVGDNPRGQSRGGGWAKGGIRRAKQGLIVPPSDPGTTLFGEPETGGEAFIPLRGISQGRAMALAQTVGDSYGFAVGLPSGSSRFADMRSSGQMGWSGGGGRQDISLTLAVTGNSRDWLAQGVQHALDEGRIQAFVNGQLVQSRRT